MLTPTLTHGLPRGLKLLGEPVREIRFSRRDVDQVRDSWLMPGRDTLREGDPHPELAGCIIDEAAVRGPFGSAGQAVWECDMTSLGDARGERPWKILNRGKRRTLESGWDERAVRVLSWHADWRPCKGLAGSNVIHCEGHGFRDGQRVVFARKTGGSGLTAQSSTSLGVVYFVCNRGTHQFQVSTTKGGAPAALTTDMTAAEVIAAEFALGATHPDHATMHLCELNVQDENTDWRTADCVYRGLEEAKPYHRMITVNGQQSSSTEPIVVNLPGGWLTPLNSNIHLPEVVVTDTYLAGSGSLLTGSVPSMSIPPNPPTIASYVISADPEQLVFNYPYGWTLIATPHAATLNSQIQAMVYSLVYRYIWPVQFK